MRPSLPRTGSAATLLRTPYFPGLNNKCSGTFGFVSSPSAIWHLSGSWLPWKDLCGIERMKEVTPAPTAPSSPNCKHTAIILFAYSCKKSSFQKVLQKVLKLICFLFAIPSSFVSKVFVTQWRALCCDCRLRRTTTSFPPEPTQSLPSVTNRWQMRHSPHGHLLLPEESAFQQPFLISMSSTSFHFPSNPWFSCT